MHEYAKFNIFSIEIGNLLKIAVLTILTPFSFLTLILNVLMNTRNMLIGDIGKK